MQTYPDKELVVRALLQAAENAAKESSSSHPEDIATSMTFAMETTAPVLMWLHENGYLK